MKAADERESSRIRKFNSLSAFIRDNLRLFLYVLLAVLLWLAPLVLVSITIIRNPAWRTVTPVFHHAVEHWWSKEPLYSDAAFHYFPQFALLFTVFHSISAPFGDIVWRAISVAVLLYGSWKLIETFQPANSGRLFFFTSLLALGPCFDALRNGQTNLVFGGLAVLTAALLVSSRWWPASICLIILLTIKPLGLVLLLLAPLVYRQLLRRVSILLAVFILAPFLFTDSNYLLSQYRDAAEHLFAVSATSEHRFADFNGLLRTLGVHLSAAASQIIRLIAALFVLILWLTGARRTIGFQRAILLLILANTYLMLFNPMTEVNSYAIIAPTLAVFAVYCLSINDRWLWWINVFILVSIAIFPELFRRVDPDFGLWWDPLMMMMLSVILLLRTLYRKDLSCQNRLR